MIRYIKATQVSLGKLEEAQRTFGPTIAAIDKLLAAHVLWHCYKPTSVSEKYKIISFNRYMSLDASPIQPNEQAKAYTDQSCVISRITPTMRPEEFDLMISHFPIYRLKQGNPAGVHALAAAANCGNVALVEHIHRNGDRNLVNLLVNGSAVSNIIDKSPKMSSLEKTEMKRLIYALRNEPNPVL